MIFTAYKCVIVFNNVKCAFNRVHEEELIKSPWMHAKKTSETSENWSLEQVFVCPSQWCVWEVTAEESHRVFKRSSRVVLWWTSHVCLYKAKSFSLKTKHGVGKCVIAMSPTSPVLQLQINWHDQSPQHSEREWVPQTFYKV